MEETKTRKGSLVTQELADKCKDGDEEKLRELLAKILSLLHGTLERECIHILIMAIYNIVASSEDEDLTMEWATNLFKTLSEINVNDNLTL
ncbi:MAG: hypothetical protein K0R76_1517, partial [Alphaproteobacteria bacterium]|nr:hypothetical protein [Alphaproteobacteria bacterium]